LSSDKDEVYKDYEGNEIIVTKPDEVIWTDHKGQRITVVSDEKGNLKTSEGDEIVQLQDGSYYN
jgi:hypothetical protein